LVSSYRLEPQVSFFCSCFRLVLRSRIAPLMPSQTLITLDLAIIATLYNMLGDPRIRNVRAKIAREFSSKSSPGRNRARRWICVILLDHNEHCSHILLSATNCIVRVPPFVQWKIVTLYACTMQVSTAWWSVALAYNRYSALIHKSRVPSPVRLIAFPN